MKSTIFLFIGLIVLAATYLYTFQKPWLVKNFSQQHTVLNSGQLTGRYDPGESRGEWMGTFADSYQIKNSKQLANQILGVNNSNKRIEVDLTNQRLYAYEGDNQIYNFPISSGLYDWTPRGIFYTWIKLKYAKMSGGSKALGTYYYLPNVPFIQYFGNDEIPNWRGFGIHGAYWHNDFGRPKSHGCINLKPEDAEQLFYWTPPPPQGNMTKITPENPGIPIHIYGKYQG